MELKDIVAGLAALAGAIFVMMAIALSLLTFYNGILALYAATAEKGAWWVIWLLLIVGVMLAWLSVKISEL